MTNKYGLDVHYFTKKLNQIANDAQRYTPGEMARDLFRLVLSTGSSNNIEEKIDGVATVGVIVTDIQNNNSEHTLIKQIFQAIKDRTIKPDHGDTQKHPLEPISAEAKIKNALHLISENDHLVFPKEIAAAITEAFNSAGLTGPFYVKPKLTATAKHADQYLDRAADLIRERGVDYDDSDGARYMPAAVKSFNAITRHQLTEADGFLFMSQVKRARQWQHPDRYHRDSAEDDISFTALIAESLDRQFKKGTKQ